MTRSYPPNGHDILDKIPFDGGVNNDRMAFFLYRLQYLYKIVF